MPISDCEVRDPRIRRTRQLLQGALRTLMQTKGFDEISVQDITDAATVNRATFYDHYTDKYALLDAMIAGGFHLLLHERNVVYDGTCPSAISVLILATCDYLTLTHSGTECTRQSAFEPLVDAAITTAIRRVLIAGMKPADTTSAPANNSASDSRSSASELSTVAAPSPEIIASAASWAIYGAVKEWSHTPNHPPAETIVPEILQLILPMLPTHPPATTPSHLSPAELRG
jgi:AcrR family transcriptional regulator